MLSPLLNSTVFIIAEITIFALHFLYFSTVPFISLDGVYDCRKNRKAIFNAGMIPNINENKRNRKKSKRGRKQMFIKRIFKERFFTISNCKFKKSKKVGVYKVDM